MSRARLLVLMTLVMTLTAALAPPAAAAPPERFTITQQTFLQDGGENCGFVVRWDINLTVDITNFRDNDGTLIRQHGHVRELNTITRLDTGYSVVDGPVSFLQRTLFHPDGSRTIEINGLSLKVNAETGRLFDVGRFVLARSPDGTTRIVQSSGQHVPRELIPDGVIDERVLAAFCDVLS